MKTYGRKTIYANFTEDDILNADLETQKKIILDILNNAKSIHELNNVETKYIYR